MKGLIKLTLNLAVLNVVGDVLGGTAINLAASGESGTEDLLDGALKRLGHRLEPHGAGNVNDLVQRDGLGVLDVLLLLTVTRGLLESLDNQGGSGGNDRDGGLTVLDGEADRDTETLPVTTEKICLSAHRSSHQHLRRSTYVALAISSPTFLGDRPRGPILGARADEAPTSPPVALRWIILTSLGSNLGLRARAH